MQYTALKKVKKLYVMIEIGKKGGHKFLKSLQL